MLSGEIAHTESARVFATSSSSPASVASSWPRISWITASCASSSSSRYSSQVIVNAPDGGASVLDDRGDRVVVVSVVVLVRLVVVDVAESDATGVAVPSVERSHALATTRHSSAAATRAERRCRRVIIGQP